MSEVPNEVKVHVLEKLDATREQFTKQVEQANQRANKVLARVATIIGIITVIGAFAAAKMATYQHFREKGADKLLDDMNATLIAFQEGGLRFPIGTIVAVRGNSDAANLLKKHGWVVCDGANGTPNLVGKFLLGTDATSTPGYAGRDKPETGVVKTGDLNRHQHETPIMNPGSNTAVLPNGCPFGRGSKEWPRELENGTNGDSAGTGENGAPHREHWKLSNFVFPKHPQNGTSVDLNAHTHVVDLPPHYTVVYMMRMK